jgi:glucose-6-phosphate isomerase
MIKLTNLDLRDPNWEKLNAITGRLAIKDPNLWGESASAEAAIRLDWVDLPESSRELLAELDALSAWSREVGHENFILCGMGGSSLAPEVIAASYKKELVVLDSTEPSQIARALERDLSKSCIIIASKSGSTIETASQRALFESELTKSGLDPKSHLVIVTDPASPLDLSARAAGLKVVNANPKVGGRFSALSAFGLTPAALIGVDISILLDDAVSAAQEFTKPDSSVVRMASFLARSENAFPSFYDKSSPIPGISDWIEQLIAESTGKDGKGVLPVVVESETLATITFDGTGQVSVIGELGAQFIFWEWVTALLGYLLEVDPFNQPNVAESKERTGKILGSRNNQKRTPTFATGNLEVFTDSQSLTLRDALANHLQGGYIAIMAYLDRIGASRLSALRAPIASATKLPTTFGWGPRFLHSTGQFHKGGPLIGSFIQITCDSELSIPIPGSDFDFATLISAQAAGDREALQSRGLKVLQIHLKNREAGIAEILEAAASL